MSGLKLSSTSNEVSLLDMDKDCPGENSRQTESSAKIDQLVRLLQLTPQDQKSVVFSQFTSFLDRVRLLRAAVLAVDRCAHAFGRRLQINLI